MKAIKIGQGYWQSGYRRWFKKTPSIYLIENKLYAKDSKNASTAFDGDRLEEGYVCINESNYVFYQTCLNKHVEYRICLENIKTDKILYIPGLMDLKKDKIKGLEFSKTLSCDNVVTSYEITIKYDFPNEWELIWELIKKLETIEEGSSKKFIDNLLEQGLKDFKKSLHEKRRPSRLVCAAFVWKKTKEGHDYWVNIYSNILSKNDEIL